MKKIYVLLMLIVAMMCLCSCDNSEKDYAEYEIKISDGLGNEWIATKDNLLSENALQISLPYEEGLKRYISCTQFRFTEKRQWDSINKKWLELDDDWYDNGYLGRFVINWEIYYRATKEDKWEKYNKQSISKRGYYSFEFEGDGNGVWDHKISYSVDIEVQ